MESTAVSAAVQPAQQGTMALTVDDQLGFIADAVRTFEGVQKLAAVISSMESCPVHLKGKASDCFRVVVQAVKWRMDPFAVAECTSLVHGRLCYEGKLVAAVLRSMGAIVGRIEYDQQGKGQEASITVTGMPKGARKAVSLGGSVKEWRTFGKDKQGNPMKNAWDTMPETMLIYRGTRQWARAYAPEAILGVYTPDEIEDLREVEGTVVHTDPPPARTGAAAAPAATENGGPAQPGTEQPSGGSPTGSSASAGGQSPAAGSALQPAHPVFTSSRDLHRCIGKARGNTALLARLCKIHGGTTPLDTPTANLDALAADIAKVQAVAANADQTLELIGKLEVDAQEAAREAAAEKGASHV